MSLLLDALKKAEKAKEEAQRAKGEASPAAQPAAPPAQPAAQPMELRLQDDPEPPAPRHVTTRAELPDISQPLQILSDDIGPEKSPRGAPAPKRTAPGAAPAGRAQGAQAADGAAQERAAARKVFEAKYKEPNPRLPFYIVTGALGVAAVGVVIYFWLQLRPAPSLVNTNPPPSGAQMAAAPAAPVAPPAASAPSGPVAAIPGLPTGAPTPNAAAAPAQPAAPVVPAAPAASAPERAAPVARAPVARAPAQAPRMEISPQRSAEVAIVRNPPQVHPRVDAAYGAYLAGDLAGARAGYQEALRDEPNNRDALLGLAAVDVRSGRLEAAESAYMQLLRADPRDPHAQAGMLALRGGRLDPLAAESRVKTLLAADPDAHVLNFTLGNQLAQQGRWAEAQLQYFKAFSADPENGDFAYNLAVSLDHLRQGKLAAEYYQRALQLAGRRGASFDAAAARLRLQQLAR